MRAFDIISKKRDGATLGVAEIEFLIAEFMSGRVSEAQMAAWLMAVYWRGLDIDETAALTRAMIASGEVVDLSDLSGKKIDKHSTGGVGDKITLVAAPLAAAAGIKVPKMSGGGLGHTGGTLDKLASIPGMRTDIGIVEFKRILDAVGVALVGQSADLVPADKRIYALRDQTATVASTSLITASVMSKKLAAGADAIVLDVKVGSGAFVKTLTGARALAKNMAALGRSMDRPVRAVISNMNRPLGAKVGNALEIEEVIEVLKGSGPADVRELSIKIAAEMLVLSGQVDDENSAIKTLTDLLDNGRALGKFREIIAAQGGDNRIVDDPELLPQASRESVFTASESGYLKFSDTERLGLAALELGAGRRAAADPIDPGAGLVILKREGEPVKAGEPLVSLRYGDAGQPVRAVEHIRAAIRIIRRPPKEEPLVYGVIR